MAGLNVLGSRLTFREKVDICWQRQLRDKYLEEGTPPVPHLDVKQAIVRPVSRRLAEQIILKYEWLGTLPHCNRYYGIFFGDYCAGVSCVGIGGGGANVYAYKEFGLASQAEFAYLMRGANVHWSPPGANSKLTAWTCKLLAKEHKAKLIIAYADTDAGEIGTIYQACNWAYIGIGSSTMQWVAPGSGRVYDQKFASNVAKRHNIPRKDVTIYLISHGWRNQQSNPKHRYVYVLDKSDKALAERIENMRQPYPKRGRGEIDNAPQANVETGGASPTRPLFEDGE